MRRWRSSGAARRRRASSASALRGGTTVDARTAFQGYEGLESEGRVVALLKGGSPVEELRNGEEGEVVLDRTPFYAEAGGQVGDTGTLTGAGSGFLVRDTIKRGAAHSHLGRVSEGTIASAMSFARRWTAERRRGGGVESYGDTPAACGAAQEVGHARAAEGLAGRARPAALRLLAFPTRHCGGAH